MRYLIDGCYGDGNVGDEALLQAVRQLVERHDRDAAIRVMSADPPATELLHGVPAILQTNPFGAGFYGAVCKGQLLPTVRAIRWADCFLLGGGELFRDDVGARATFGMFYRLFLAAAFNKRLIALSVGAQEPTTRFGTLFLKAVMNRTHDLVFRDDESASIAERMRLRKTRIRISSDVVLTEVRRFAPALETDHWSRSGHRLRVCVALKALRRNHRFKAACGESALVEHVAEGLCRLGAQRELAVTVLVFATRDLNLADTLGATLAASGLSVAYERSGRTDRLASTMRHADLVVAMPLHASVFAFGLGVPAIGIDYDRKVRKFYGQFGADRFCLAPAVLNGESISSACLAALEVAPALRLAIESRVHKETQNTEEIARDLFMPEASPPWAVGRR